MSVTAEQDQARAVTVARCTVERLMRRLGLRGAVRGKVVRTKVPDAKVHPQPPPAPP